jgi:hypothetical protein
MVKKSIIRPADASDEPPDKLAIKRAMIARENGFAPSARTRHSAHRGAGISSC